MLLKQIKIVLVHENKNEFLYEQGAVQSHQKKDALRPLADFSPGCLLLAAAACSASTETMNDTLRVYANK